MAAPGNVEWDTCAEDDCIGVRLPTGGKCWAHAHDQDLDAALKQFGEDGRLDARGVLITQDLLERLLTAAPHDDHGHLLLTDARFDRATFQDTAWFRDATFQGDAWFDRTTFRSDADFSAATLQGAAVFNRATFHHRAAFGGASFQRAAVFNRATFHHLAVFGGATFHHRAVFDGATFQDDTSFNRATFHHLAAFGGATFQRAASFGAATFQDDAVFPGVTFQRTATFDEATFQRARQLGPMLVRKSLKLDGATFHERVQIEVAAAAVCCQRARFLAGVQLRVRWAQVVLSDADLAAPSTLTGTPPFPSFDEEPLARILRRLRRPMHVWDGWPRLLSLRGADLAGLAVSNVDLRACRFGGAHNLDKLRIEGDDALGFAPPSWRWTKRQVIAEEHDWRSDQGEGAWDRPAYTSPAWLAVERLEPAQIASLYRALRKGHEDNKDEPGAADLYYGETEMRRHARRLKARQAWQEHHWGKWATVKPEHAVLWLYWLVSGYGLRAWRALATFLAVLVVAASLFAFGGGFASSTTATAASPSATTLPASTSANSTATIATADTSFGGALVYSARTVIGLTREPQPRLTRFGDVVQILIRILGPVLLGLAVLSVRGRVKR